MNIIKITAILAVVLALAACGNQARSEKEGHTTEVVEGLTTSTFKVWGNCDMCKETIESSLKTDGISNVNWNKNTKLMTVAYDDKKITLTQIQKSIASVGYDTESFKGDDKAYGELPDCCQYERK